MSSTLSDSEQPPKLRRQLTPEAQNAACFGDYGPALAELEAGAAIYANAKQNPSPTFAELQQHIATLQGELRAARARLESMRAKQNETEALLSEARRALPQRPPRRKQAQ